MRPLLALTVLALGACGSADLDGRAGNRALERGQPETALSHYGAGLLTSDSSEHALQYRLWNNAALAELARDSARAALAHADNAADAAASSADRAEAAYHGGVAAAGAGATDEALARFRRALVLEGGAEDAAFNWEVIARQERRSGRGGDGKGAPTPPENGEDGSPEPGEGSPSPTPPSETPPRPDPSQAPPRLSPEEAQRLLDALAREEAGLVRRTVRGNPAAARPTKDW